MLELVENLSLKLSLDWEHLLRHLNESLDHISSSDRTASNCLFLNSCVKNRSDGCVGVSHINHHSCLLPLCHQGKQRLWKDEELGSLKLLEGEFSDSGFEIWARNSGFCENEWSLPCLSEPKF